MHPHVPYHHRNTGNGLGGVFKSLSGIIRPLFASTKEILKPLGKEIGKEGLSFLTSTANDALSGATLKDSLKKNYKKSQKKVKKKITKAAKKVVKGKGKKKVKGQKNSAKKNSKSTNKKKKKSLPSLTVT